MKKISNLFKGSKSNFLSLSIKKQDQSKTVKFFVNEEKGTVVCRLYDRWYDMYHVGKAQCHDVDEFNEKRGRAIAFNRARQKELEYNLKHIAEDRAYWQEVCDEQIVQYNKREEINTIYLEGVKDELKNLIK